MPNTFMTKVAAERRVLHLVNSHIAGGNQLAGLSRGAIGLWQSTLPGQLSAQLVQLLIDISSTCQALSDRSHQTMLELGAEAQGKLEAQLQSLDTLIRASARMKEANT